MVVVPLSVTTFIQQAYNFINGSHFFHECDRGALYMHCALCLSLASVNVYIIKVFRGRDVDILDAQLKLLFRNVVCAKPRSSRNSSIGNYAYLYIFICVVCTYICISVYV